MPSLGDDEVGLILNWVTDPNDRKSFSWVCKQWLRVEGLSRSSLRVLEPNVLLQILPRFPNLLTFETSKFMTDTDLAFLAQTCPKIEAINLNLKTPRGASHEFDEVSVFGEVGDEGLCPLANGCPRLSKVLLRRRKNIGNAGLVWLTELAHNLTHLDLGWCSLVSDQALEAIGSASSIRVLNLQGCSSITDIGLAHLSNGSSSKTMKKLVLAECDRITDLGVSLLQQMCCLEELNLAECGPRVTDVGGVAIAKIETLKKLKLSWLINVSDHTLVALAENCPNLEILDLTGCELVTGVGVRAFWDHRYLEALVLRSCFNISGSDVELIAFGCRSMKSMVLDKGLRTWISSERQESINRFVSLVWW